MDKTITIFSLFIILISAFITSGGAGFLNFSILSKLDAIKLKPDEKTEKNLYIMLFSILNFAVFINILGPDQIGNTEIIELSTLAVIKAISLTLLISIVTSLTVLPFVFLGITKAINHIRKNWLHLATISNKDPKELLFSKQEYILVYIFTLSDNKFVDKGYLEHWGSEDIGNKQLSLTPPADYTDIEIETVRDLYINNEESMNTKLLIDAENNLKYFIFYNSINNNLTT